MVWLKVGQIIDPVRGGYIVGSRFYLSGHRCCSMQEFWKNLKGYN